MGEVIFKHVKGIGYDVYEFIWLGIASGEPSWAQ
jgi:hypothetical protein